MRYVALLRGINVGGKNIVTMAALRAVFEELGFLNVSTYINSGNVLFTVEGAAWAEEAREALQARLTAAVFERFGAEVPVAVFSADEIRDMLDHAPGWWGVGNGEIKHNALFVIPPVTPRDIVEQVGPEKPEYEQVVWHGQVIFWTAPFKTFNRTQWARIITLPAYNVVTIRNANTARKLAKLLE